MQTQTMGATVVPHAGHKTLSVFGIQVDVLLTAEDTKGAFSTYRLTVNPGEGIPPHMHSGDDESYYVVEGEFEFYCGGSVSILTAGSQALLPRNLPHAVRNIGVQPGQLLGIITPGGHEKFFEDASRLATGEDFDLEEAIAVCSRHGMELLASGEEPATA